MIVTPCPLCQSTVEIYQGEINRKLVATLTCLWFTTASSNLWPMADQLKTRPLTAKSFKAKQLEEIAAK
jgi:hypothetical protein